ncbi:MAG TPA: HEAT repeat domain-containing protein [Vicinamibacterales bacterium]|nr:HEAT repeat domain-containing protein [Vicinamibacterales bacterium]
MSVASSHAMLRARIAPRRFSPLVCALALLVGARPMRAQEPAAPQSVTREQLQSAIDKLGDLDYAARTTASRTIRRAATSQAVPALLQAASDHADGYVRYRALVLLTGFNDPRTKDSMRASLSSPNDRLRTVAYSFFEHNPDRSLLPDFLNALEKEQGEFVRPTLVRAVAALAAMSPSNDDTKVRQALVREVNRGADFFRSAVVEALGDYKAQYAYDALTAIAKLDGPLQEDAALALGKIGDKRALETLAGLQRTAPRKAQPSIAAAVCLLGVNCGSHENYLVETLKFSDRNIGFQELLRSAASGLGALAVAGHTEAADALIEVGIPSRDPTRAPVALALGTVALRNTPLMMTKLETRSDRDGAIALIAEGFDMLEEDLDKERFFVLARRTFWESPDGSSRRALMQTLIGKLDF